MSRTDDKLARRSVGTGSLRPVSASRRPPIANARTGLVAGAVVLVAVVLAVVLLSSSGSTARRPQPVFESLFQDDNHLVYAPTATVARTLDTLAGLGVDRLRITVLWAAIAPGSNLPVQPAHFNGADPAAYSPGAWAPYDRIVTMAAARHLAVDFNITAPGPLWAMGHPAPQARLASHYEPSVADFRAFVTAVGRRYSGSYVAPGGHAVRFLASTTGRSGMSQTSRDGSPRSGTRVRGSGR